MNWGSWSEFVAMGGHGAFVWGAYGFVAIALVTEVLMLTKRRIASKHAIWIAANMNREREVK